MTSVRLTECPKCHKVDTDEVITIHNPGTRDLNADATLRCVECGHDWEGRVTAPLFQIGGLPDYRDLTRSAYTVGNVKGYDGALANPTQNNPTRKIGRRIDYEGGWVWKTAEDAFSFLGTDAFSRSFPGQSPSDFGVYLLALPAGWDIDVSQAPHQEDGVHRLLNDAVIVRRV